MSVRPHFRGYRVVRRGGRQADDVAVARWPRRYAGATRVLLGRPIRSAPTSSAASRYTVPSPRRSTACRESTASSNTCRCPTRTPSRALRALQGRLRDAEHRPVPDERRVPRRDVHVTGRARQVEVPAQPRDIRWSTLPTRSPFPRSGKPAAGRAPPATTLLGRADPRPHPAATPRPAAGARAEERPGRC